MHPSCLFIWSVAPLFLSSIYAVQSLSSRDFHVVANQYQYSNPAVSVTLGMSNSEASALLAVSIAFPILAALFVVLRFLARRVRSGAELDDWITVGALVKLNFKWGSNECDFLTTLDPVFRCWCQYYHCCGQRSDREAGKNSPRAGKGNSTAKGKSLPLLLCQQVLKQAKVIYADSFLCFAALAVIKVAVLLFYNKVFPPPPPSSA